MVAVISDGQTCTKLTQFDQFGTKMKDGNTYIIRGHSIRGNEPPYFINVTGRTMFFRTTHMEVRKDLHHEAEALLHSASPVTPLSECHTSQGLMTVEGQVVEASFFIASSIKIVKWQ